MVTAISAIAAALQPTGKCLCLQANVVLCENKEAGESRDRRLLVLAHVWIASTW